MVDVAEKQVINCPDLSHLPDVAKSILSFVKEDKIMLFKGELGAGKTTLIKEICKLHHVIDSVSSPTFSIAVEYKTKDGETLYHFDFFRIKSLEEVQDIGVSEYFFSGNVCLVEWPEIVKPLFKGEYTEINITVENDESRIFELTRNG